MGKEKCKLCKKKISENFGKCYFLDEKLRVYCDVCSKKIENLSKLPEVMIIPINAESFERVIKTKTYSHPIRYFRRGGKFVAFYRSQPVSAITHFAKVDEILTEKQDKKYLLEKVIKLENPVIRGDYSPLQGTKNTTLKNLLKSKTLKELFAK
jgi:hypothetical protein